jgi:V/A-type H+-transporting ATPase subunit I
MVHLNVQVPSRDGPAVTRRIAAEGLLHLVDIGHGAAPAGAGPATRELLARARDLARSIRHVAASLDLPLGDIAGAVSGSEIADYAVECERIEQELRPVRESVEGILARLSEAREQGEHARTTLAHVTRLASADVDRTRLSRLQFAQVRLGYGAAPDLDALAELLTPHAFAIVPLDADPRALTAVVVPASATERLDTALRVSAFEPLTAGASDDRQALAGRIAESERAEQTAGAELSELKATTAGVLQSLAHRADTAVVLLQAQTFFAAAGRFLVIVGWIPEERAADLTTAIVAASGGRAVVTVEKPEDLPAASASTLRAPILYRNPLLLRPFEQLIDLYGVPSYTEIQPTAFFAVSFLLMFGLMFGDLGHGLVLVLAGYCLFRWVPRFLDYGILLMEAGAAASVFGVLYGSLFGVESLLPTLWLRPIHDLTRFIRVAVMFGVGLVTGGLVLNVVNTWRAGERADALVSARGLFGAFAYWSALALLARTLLPGTMHVPGAAVVTLFAIALGLIVARPLIVRALGRGRPAAAHPGTTPWWLSALEGSVELVDTLFSYFANTISFVRVAAFAAVHAGVFIAVFALADTLAAYRFGGPLSIAVLVAGNAVIILLEGLTVTVQVLRLEYYEFFGKFFRGGGEPYRPLMLRSSGTQGGRDG